MTSTNIMSLYLKEKLINHMFRNTIYTPPQNVYLALYIDDENGFREVNEEGYARAMCPDFTIVGDVATNSTQIDFQKAIDYWGTITHMGILDESTGGNLLFSGALSNSLGTSASSINIDINNNLRIDAGNLLIIFSGDETGGWGISTAENILGGVLNNSTLDFPGNTVYLGLGWSLVNNQYYNFLSWLEVSASDYSRKQISGTDGWSSPTGTGITNNNNEILFTEGATLNWGNLVNTAIFNSSSGGDVLLWGTLDSIITVSNGDGFRFPAGDISISMQTSS